MELIPNQFTIFKILPSYKYQNEKSKFIYFDEDILIVTYSSKDGYLGIQNKLDHPQNFERSEESDESCDSDKSLLNNYNEEFVISQEKLTNFKFQKFYFFNN